MRSPRMTTPDGSTAREKRLSSVMAAARARRTGEDPVAPPETPTEAEASVGRFSIRSDTPLSARRLRPAARAVPAPVPTAAASAAGIRSGHDRIVLMSRQRLLSAQLDLSFSVAPDHLHENRIALVDDVLDPLVTPVLERGDVHQPVLVREDLDERAQRPHSAKGRLVHAPYVSVLGDPGDGLSGSICVR